MGTCIIYKRKYISYVQLQHTYMQLLELKPLPCLAFLQNLQNTLKILPSLFQYFDILYNFMNLKNDVNTISSLGYSCFIQKSFLIAFNIVPTQVDKNAR